MANLPSKSGNLPWRRLPQILGNRLLLGVYLGQFGIATITWFFLTWFPTYLMQARGMSMLKVGLVASIPALFGFLGGLFGGYISDWLLRKGGR